MSDVKKMRRLEEAGLNAWPALQTVLLDGWVLRFAGGYTKRANSTNPTYPIMGVESESDLRARVEVCEAIYARRGLPSIFRLTSFGVPNGLDDLLADRGYRVFDRTLVLGRSLADSMASAERPDVRATPLDEWLDRYVEFNGAALDKRDTHAAMLRQISGEPLFGLLHDASGEPVACGLAVREGGLVGLFDIVTDRARRKQGFGRALVSALLTWARDRGAQEAYLQVVGTNEPAIHLYRALGFVDAYHYWYRVPPV
jgi:GNAT superfamily N-acetyltransferase